jgi:hypothetical protein
MILRPIGIFNSTQLNIAPITIVFLDDVHTPATTLHYQALVFIYLCKFQDQEISVLICCQGQFIYGPSKRIITIL